MRFGKRICCVFLVLAFAACFHTSTTIAEEKPVDTSSYYGQSFENLGKYSTSVLHLRLFPENYDNKDVSVSGYLIGDDFQVWLYLSKEDAEMTNTPLGVLIDIPNVPDVVPCLDNYVQVWGTFDWDEENKWIRIKDVEDIYTFSFEKRSTYSRACYYPKGQ